MIQGQEEPTVPESLFNSKLSPTVPAFVPGVIYNPSLPFTVSSSSLSPDVPEFYPSVSHRYHVPQPTEYSDGTAFHDTDNSARHEVCEQLEYNLTAPPKKTKTKTEKSERFNRGNKWKVSDSEANESLCTNGFENSRKLSKVRSKSTNNKSSRDADPSRNKKEFLRVNPTESQQGKADGTIQILESGNSGENNTGNQDYCSLQQSHTLHWEKLDSCAKEALNTPVKDSLAEQNSAKHKSCLQKEDAMPCCTTIQSDRRNHIKSAFVVSYSDKVKSPSSHNTQRNENILTDSARSWTKNFRPDSSKTKSKVDEENFRRKSSSPFTHHSNKRFAGGLNAIKVNSRTGHTPEKGENTLDTSECSQLIDGHFRGKRYSEVSANTKLQQTQQRRRLIATSVSVKTMSCNNDLNWRHKDNDVEISKFGEFKRTEFTRKLGCREKSAHLVAKRSDDLECWDSKKQETQVDYKKDEQFNHSGMARGKPAVYAREQEHAVKGESQSLTCSSTVVNSDTILTHEMCSSVQQSVTLNESKPSPSSTSESTCQELTWDFPDLKHSVKIKKPSIISSERKARNEKNLATDISVTNQEKSPVSSYSAALRSAPQPKPVSVNSAKDKHSVAKRGVHVVNLPSQSKDELEDDQNETTEKKKKKKKRKKKKDGSEKSQEGVSSKRTERGIVFDLGEMLQTLAESPSEIKKHGKKVLVATGVLPSQLTVASPPEVTPTAKAPFRNQGEKQKPHNMLDSTAPIIKRGKERETPARKKPSPLKKIILKEREEKKKAREPKDESCEVAENETCAPETDVFQPEENDDTDTTGGGGEPLPIDKKVAAEIHSRRFREYCFQVPDKEVDAVATELLKELVRFQDRQFHKNPIKAKAKRRFVLGLREVNKHLKLRKLKCVVISSNVERIKSAGGLDDTLNSIISLCQEYKVPLVFALKRQALGRVLWKRVPVSTVGIINYDGAQEHFKNLIELTEKTSQAYMEKWKEIQEKLESEEQEAEHTEAHEEPGEENKTRPAVQSRMADGKYELLKGSFPVGESVDRTNLPDDNDSDDENGTLNKSNDNKGDNDEENDFIREGDLEIENID